MKMRDMLMMTAGSMLTMAYQKYNKPVMKAMKNTFNQTMRKMDKSLDDMM